MMNLFHPQSSVKTFVKAAFAATLVGMAGIAFSASKVTLGGSEENPPVTTSASGAGEIKVNDDKSVSGSVSTTGIVGTAAHIHEGEVGKNGPVIIPLTKAAEGKWAVPEGAKLTDAQYQSYKAGKLYVNVHSDAHKDGEIRAQLKP
jgi:CHRD domain